MNQWNASSTGRRGDGGGQRERTWVALLSARFEEDLPIRDIARRWDVDPAHLHHEYAHARTAFREALLAVVRHHTPGDHDDAETECRQIMSLLG